MKIAMKQDPNRRNGKEKEGNSNITYICCDGYWMHEIGSALNK